MRYLFVYCVPVLCRLQGLAKSVNMTFLSQRMMMKLMVVALNKMCINIERFHVNFASAMKNFHV